MSDLKDKTLFISGGSRGIGLAIALRAAHDGANIVIVAKTDAPNPKLPGTIYTAAEEIEAVGGKCLPLKVDIRDQQQIAQAVDRTVETFGGIDVLINNASAINLTGTLETSMKRFDLMIGVNVRGTFACSQACIPHLKRADNPQILMLSPPLSMKPEWFKHHTAYTISKFGMSMCVLGMSAEFRDDGIAVNALWPRSVIDTAALAMLGGAIKPENCRSPRIVADAAHAILTRNARQFTGEFCIDEEVLAAKGITDLSVYSQGPESKLFPDLFVEQ